MFRALTLPGETRGGQVRVLLVEWTRSVVDGQVAQDPGLGVDVLQDGPAAGFHEHELTRSQAATPDRVRGGQGHGARLRRDDHEPVATHGEGRRAQTVSVDEGTHAPTVREHDRRRAVPGGQHPGGPATQRGDVGVRRSSELQGFGDRREQCWGQVPTGHGQQLQALVQRERVGTIRRKQGARRRQLRRDRFRAEVPGPAADLLPVAADRVYLTVVGDRPEGLGKGPGGVRVRGVALVEHRVAHRQGLAKIREEAHQPTSGHQALVDDRQGRGRRDGKICDVATCCPSGRLQATPGDDQSTLKGDIAEWSRITGGARRAGDDRLCDRRTSGGRGRTKGSGVHGHVTPGDHGQRCGGEDLLHQGSGRTFRWPGARQEEHEDRRPVMGDGLPRDQAEDGRVEREGDPGPIAGCPVRPECAAVTQGRQPRERQRQDPFA